MLSAFQGGDVIMAKCWALGAHEKLLISLSLQIRLRLSLKGAWTQTKGASLSRAPQGRVEEDG